MKKEKIIKYMVDGSQIELNIFTMENKTSAEELMKQYNPEPKHLGLYRYLLRFCVFNGLRPTNLFKHRSEKTSCYETVNCYDAILILKRELNIELYEIEPISLNQSQALSKEFPFMEDEIFSSFSPSHYF